MSFWASYPEIGDDGEGPGTVLRWWERYPATDDSPASVSLAAIPSYCVPGNADDESTDAVGPWLRLDTFDREWHPVVLDETAARTLRDQLTQWLDRTKVHPR